jgi:hypothetical protein
MNIEIKILDYKMRVEIKLFISIFIAIEDVSERSPSQASESTAFGLFAATVLGADISEAAIEPKERFGKPSRPSTLAFFRKKLLHIITMALPHRAPLAEHRRWRNPHLTLSIVLSRVFSLSMRNAMLTR